MTIEQEFFEVFKPIECKKCNDKYCVNAGAEKYPTQCSKHEKVKITPEIVLGLMKIISKKEDIRVQFYKDKFILSYELGAYPDGCITGEIESENKDFNLSVLELITKVNKSLWQDWQQEYKDEIQSQVRALFNAM